MDPVHLIDWSREAIRMALVLAGPPLAAAVLIALVIGVIQTITQMQESVVAQVPRQVAILVVVLALLPWMLTTWVTYARSLIESLGV